MNATFASVPLNDRNPMNSVSKPTQVPNLAEGGDEIERDEDDACADEADEEVELQVGLAAVGPRQRDVDQEPDHRLQRLYLQCP